MVWGAGRKIAQRDPNEPPIVKAMRTIGAYVCIMDTPCDLLVGYHGHWICMEVKTPPGPRGGKSNSGQKLNENQIRFRDRCKADGLPFYVVTDTEQALNVVRFGMVEV